jgi:hypothetical protein
MELVINMRFLRSAPSATPAPRGGRRARSARPVVAVLAGLVCLLGSLAVPASLTSAGAATGATSTTAVSAYWLVAADGGIFSFGGAPFYGSTGAMHLNKPVVGMASTPMSGGYWLVASDGGIFSFGNAGFYGSTGNIRLNKPVVGMAATADGDGYWSVASDGGIFAFGDAQFYGSMGAQHLNQPIVGMAATPDGGGYWLVAADGGIFAFGDATFYGSTGNIHLNQPIVGMTATPDGHGYWFTASDGGVFAFGDAQFYGSLGDVPQKRPIVAITSDASGNGYWFANSNGAVSAFGDATYWGSAPQVISQPVVGMAVAVGTGSFTGSSYQSGSFGYDISNFQAPGNYPPAPHTIGVVEVVGGSKASTNKYLASQAQWAGGGLNLYVYLTAGNDPSSGDPACSSSAAPYAASATACNFGFNTAVDAFTKAAAAGVNTSVGWWLDVEKDPSWSTNLAANAAMVQGAIDGLHYEGLNGVGIYASPGTWNAIVGSSYQPAVPYWAASWGVDPATTCANVRSQFSSARLPTGPVQLVQYSSPSTPTPRGGMSTTYDDDYAC